MKTMIIEKIPEEVHRGFKAMCYAKGSDMRTELVNFMSGCAETVTVQAPKKDKHGQ